MAFRTAYFVLTTKYSPFEPGWNPRLEQWKGWWNITQEHRPIGDVFVFEREDACRRLYEYKVSLCTTYGSDTTIRYMRAFTRKGAAESGFRGEGEIIENYRPTYEEAKELTRRAKEEDFRRHQRDNQRYRAVIDRAHSRFPNIDRSQVPAVDDQSSSRETIYLQQYVAGLYQCGAIPDNEIDVLLKSVETGHGDLRYSDFAPVVEMVPNS